MAVSGITDGPTLLHRLLWPGVLRPRAVMIRVVIGVLLLNFCVMIVVSWSLWQSRQNDLERARQAVLQQSKVLELDYSRLIDTVDQLLLFTIDEYNQEQADGGLDLDRLQHFMARQTERVPEVLGLRLTDAQGVVRLASGDVAIAGADLSMRPRFAQLRDNPGLGLVIEGPVLGHTSGQQVVAFARRLNNLDGSFAGEVHAALGLEQMAQGISALALGQRGSVSLWNNDVALILRYTRQDGFQSGAGYKMTKEFQGLLAQNAAPLHIRSVMDGVEREYYLRAIKGRNLSVVLGIADDEVLTPWYGEVRRAVLLVGLFFLLSILLVGLLYRGWRLRHLTALALAEQQTSYVALLEQSRARAEEAQRRTELILASAGEGICGIDLNGRVSFINQSARRMLGWEEDEGLGAALHDVIHHCRNDGRPYAHDDCPTCQLLLGNRLNNEPVRVSDDVYWRKDGTSFPVEYVSTPLLIDDKVAGAVTVFHDISARKAAQEQIQYLLRYQTALLGSSPIGIASFDKDRRLLTGNPAFHQIFGNGDEHMGEISRFLYLDEGGFEDVGRRAYPVLLAGGTFRDDVSMRGGDGQEIWVRLTGHMVDGDDPDLGFVWTFEDITERKQLELELTRSNAELEQFAYVASHDLRQPLRMITSYMALIERELGAGLTEDQETFFEFATDGAKRMDRLILDLLDYSRIGRLGSGIQTVDLAEVVGDSLLNLLVAIEEAEAEIIQPESYPALQGDRSELVRLFQNIIGNAVKYRRPDVACRIELGYSRQGGDWQFWVKDNGIGIHPRDFERAFGVFQRLVPREAYEGTGIGLAICKKIVERHGGRIWIASEPGAGATFFFTLPAAGHGPYAAAVQSVPPVN